MIIRGETCYLETEEEGTPSNDGKTSPGQVWWVTTVLILWRLKQEGIDFKGSMEYIARPHFKPTNQATKPQYLRNHTRNLHPLPPPVKAQKGGVSLPSDLLKGILSGDLGGRERLSLQT